MLSYFSRAAKVATLQLVKTSLAIVLIRLSAIFLELLSLLKSQRVMQNNTTRWRDLCDKKQLIFGFIPPPAV